MNFRSRLPWIQTLTQHSQIANQALQPKVLLWGALVGSLTGLIGTIFQQIVHHIVAQRELFARSLENYPLLYWTIPCLITMAMVSLSFELMRRFAPDASGSGIPQIEGRLEGILPTNWKRVLPVKFFGGILSLGSGMVAGFEGPTIQIGGSIGQMLGGWFRANPEQIRILIAAGAASGLTAAFNAPLAGVVFVTEEMNPQFEAWPLAYRVILIACTFSTMVERFVRGDQGAVIKLTRFARVPLESLWMFVLLGIFLGLVGYLFNRYLFRALNWFSGLPKMPYRLTGLWVGVIIGIISLIKIYLPGSELIAIPWGGSGENAIIWAFDTHVPGRFLILVFLARFALTLFCYGSGAIGGIFAPMLAIATIASLGIARELHDYFPLQIPHPAVMALAGMGALVAATVRAPLTAILLTIEMTDNYFVILPLLVTCITSSMVAQGLGAEPVYTALLRRAKEKRMKQINLNQNPN